MTHKWIFQAFIAIGLVMLGLACISAIFFGDFPIFEALVGIAFSILGVIGVRMANSKTR